MSEWERVRLGEVMERSRETVEIDPQNTYKQVTVRMKHKGVVLREEKSGAAINTPRQFLAQPGQFIISSIDARNGANGLIPDELGGAVVTNDFWLFNVDFSRLDREWLDLYAATSDFVGACTGASEGTTNRVRLKETPFLALEIPLPPLPEQRRIVARVKGLLGKVEEARGLREESTKQLTAFDASRGGSLFTQLEAQHSTRSIAEISTHVTSGPRDWGSDYTENGWRFYRAQDLMADGRISEQKKAFIDQSNDRPSARLEPGDLLLVITGATVGRCAHYQTENELGYISQHVALCRLDQTQIEPAFAHQVLLSPFGQEQLLGSRYGQGKPGLNLGQIRNLRLPVPPLAEQRRLLSLLDNHSEKRSALKELETKTKVTLQALPASILAQAFAGAL